MKLLTWKGMSFEAHVAKDYCNADRLAIRILYNGEALLWGWTKGYDKPKAWIDNKISINPNMVVFAFNELGMVKSNHNSNKKQENTIVQADSSEIQLLKEQMKMMQKQMEMMAANNVQMAQMLQSTITMNSMQMNITNSKEEPVIQEEDDNIEFNFDIEGEEPEYSYGEIEDNIDITEEVIEDIEEPIRRRASNRRS